jgi:deoxyribonuclease-4
LFTLDQLESSIGKEMLLLLHLNDSCGALGSHLDRHEHIGLGQIGEEGFRAVLGHPALRGLPMILETPVDSRRDDSENLRVARGLSCERE